MPPVESVKLAFAKTRGLKRHQRIARAKGRKVGRYGAGRRSSDVKSEPKPELSDDVLNAGHPVFAYVNESTPSVPLTDEERASTAALIAHMGDDELKEFAA